MVSWLVNEREMDSRLEEIGRNIVVSKLMIPQLRREHRNTTYKCRASNTNLIPPLEKTVLLDVYCTSFISSILSNYLRVFTSSSRSSEAIVGENFIETNDSRDGEGLLHRLRNDRVSSSSANHLVEEEYRLP